VLKSLGNGPDDVKSERLPKSHGGVVRFRNGVELHRGVSLLASPRERVLAERTSDPQPRALLATMKLAVETCEPGPGRLGPIFADPSTQEPSQATTESCGAGD
jgi:hypothetical protein